MDNNPTCQMVVWDAACEKAEGERAISMLPRTSWKRSIIETVFHNYAEE